MLRDERLMRLYRLLLLFGLFAYAWMACSLSSVAIVIANQGHHNASLQITADSVTVLLQHDDLAHVHEHGDERSFSEPAHPDHVVKLQQAKDVPSLTDPAKLASAKGLATATFESVPPHTRLAITKRLFAAQPPPLARSNAVELRASSVILI